MIYKPEWMLKKSLFEDLREKDLMNDAKNLSKHRQTCEKNRRKRKKKK